VEGVPLLAAGPDKALKFVPTSAAFTLVNPVAAEEEGQAAALATLRLTSALDVTADNTDGVLRVLPGAIFEIAADKTLPLATTADFSLVVEAGGTLQFQGAVLPATAAGILTVGDTKITSPTASETGVLRADGGNITFLPNNISGSGAGTRLIPLGEETGELTITVGDTSGTAETLTLTAVDLDLTDGGQLVITTDSSVDKVALAAGAVPGKITINNTLTGSPLGATDLAQVSTLSGGNKITRAANGILITTDGTVAGDLVSISGGLKTVLTFEGAASGSDVTIDAELGIGD
jgi:hypothetical protein